MPAFALHCPLYWPTQQLPQGVCPEWMVQDAFCAHCTHFRDMPLYSQAACAARAPHSCCASQHQRQPNQQDLSRVVSRRALIFGAIQIPVWAGITTALARDDSTRDSYDVYAPHYDILDGAQAALPKHLGYAALRTDTVARANGTVLEVGCGTGANLPLYLSHARNIESVTGVDTSEGMLRECVKVRSKLLAKKTNPDAKGFDIRLVHADASALPFENDSFDTVVDTFSLCVFRDPLKCLCEMARVLKPGLNSRILLLEHAISHVPALAAYQDLTAQTVAVFSKGCFWNQNVLGLVTDAGLEVVARKSFMAGTIVQLELIKS